MCASITQDLADRGLISPPKHVPGSVQLEVLMGSEAYGCSTDSSDRDIYGFCIPPKSVVFPHTAGEIEGFGQQKKRFGQFEQHGVVDPEDEQEYDFAIYNIVKYFQLSLACNPNLLDSLFVPESCVLHCTKVGQMVRDARRTFLHKGAFFKLKGYAFSQMKKMRSKRAQPGSRRFQDEQQHGFSTKFAYHLVRLINQAEQILVEHDLDLDRSAEQLKDIRAGNWTLEQVENYFHEKEAALETQYTTSTLRHGPDEPAIKQLLLNCLEEHYGSLAGCIEVPE